MRTGRKSFNQLALFANPSASFAARVTHPHFKHADMKINKTTTPKVKPAKDEALLFGSHLSDHMFEVDWNIESGWGQPHIRPADKIELDPRATVLHYAVCAFEGMKAYKDQDGKMRLFRPMMNMARMNNSCDALDLPNFDSEEFLKCISDLILMEEDWYPDREGHSFYVRPTVIGTNQNLGVAGSSHAKLFALVCPVGPYYKGGFKPVTLKVETEYVRASKGGAGAFKLGANYAPTIRAGRLAEEGGYSQCMWLTDNQVTEVGTMNLFFVVKNEQGKKELWTPPLNGLILPGVTRDSILQLCRERDDIDVKEKEFSIDELCDLIDAGRVVESFGAGTAAVVCPVEGFDFNGKMYNIPLDKANPDHNAGPLTYEMAQVIRDIQYGFIDHEWSVKLN